MYVFNLIFQNLIILTCHQHKLLVRYFTFFFSRQVFGTGYVFYRSTSQFELATLQWPPVDSASLDTPSTGAVSF